MAFARKKPSQRAAAKARREKKKEQALHAGMQAKAIVGRVLLVLLLLLACVVPVLFVASPISYIPLFAVVLVIVISFVYLRLLVGALEYSEDSLLDSCERGTEIEFVVTFKNKSVLPFVRLEPYFYISDLFGDIDTAIPASMVLMPREERDFRFEASFDHLGTYSAGVSKIVISDLLGLFQHTIINANRHEVQVLPRVFELDRLDLTNVSVQESRKAYQPIVTDDMDYAGVRDYEPGDPLKTIHWKLSSRNPEGGYFTRLFETFGNPGIDIIIDHTSPEYDSESLMQIFDAVIESALSVGIYARSVGVDATTMYLDKYGDAKSIHLLNLEESMALINDVPRIVVDEGRDCRELLQRESQSIHGEGNVAYCTAHVSEETISLLQEAKLHKRNPLLFVIVPNSMELDERRDFLRPLHRLQAAQITYYVVSSAEQLLEGTAI